MDAQDVMIQNQFLRDINPLLCGWENCRPGHSYGPAVRTYWLLHYVTCGYGKVQKGETVFPVAPGSLFIIQPEEVVFYQASQEDPWHYVWIGFEAGITLPDIFQSPVLFAPHCAPIFENLLLHIRNGSATEMFICAKIYELLSLLSFPHGRPCTTLHYVERAQNYIENQYMNPITVSHIASQLGLERSYFCRIFKAETGVAPSSYIVNVRLAHAASLLLIQNNTLEEIATQCGYNNLVNFSRMFKRRYGIAPSFYGKRHQPQ